MTDTNVKKTVASIDDVLKLVSAVLENPDTRKVMESIAASEGSGYLKWRRPTGEESLTLSKFKERWHLENNFGWPGGLKVGELLGLYFTISVEILRRRYDGVHDPLVLAYLSGKVSEMRMRCHDQSN